MNDHDRAVKVQDALRDDHHRLDALFDQLLNAVHVNDAALADAAWTDFENGILTHLEVEEQHMLPLLRREAPEEADGILDEHEKLRSLLAEIGVALEIHLVRETTVEELVGSLRAHAAREEALLYRWAETALADERKVHILERLRARAAGFKRDAA
jgi:hemerythrin-like domain-containing protein